MIDKKERPGQPLLAGALLDSNLISQTNKFLYNIKIIHCGDYTQLYINPSAKIKLNPNYSKLDAQFQKRKPAILNEFEDKREGEGVAYNTIRFDNAWRSKFSLERLIKANEGDFTTFITLTFAYNIKNILEANKKFNAWRTQMKRSFSNFKYICIPEYQRRGAVHYHLVTNLHLTHNLIRLQKGKINQYDVAYWNHGFASVFELEPANISGYLSKYMTKNMDNRLFSKKRYFYSRNLKKTITEYIYTEKEEDLNYYNKLLGESIIQYETKYKNKFTQEEIIFIELSRC